MILHTLYSQTHKILFDNYFFPSIRDNNINLCVDVVPQECSGVYMRDNWHASMITKLELCKKLAGGKDIFVHSDCDVQFFRPISESAEESLSDLDIVFQHDGQDHLCLGLFCARPSKRIIDLFNATQEVIRKYNIESQKAINIILRTKQLPYDFSDIRYGYLPKTWWTHGAETFSVWNDEELFPPDDIIAHHANWVEGVDNKIKLLSHVSEKIYKGKYEWVKMNAGCGSMDSIYGESKERFVLMPRGKSGAEVLHESRITKEQLDECVRRGAT